MRNGFFLDSGASNGIQSSNTYLLENVYGWRGICIEPNKTFFDALVRNRHCYCLNCCLYNRPGDVDFLENANTAGGILKEYHPSLLQQAKATFHIPEDMYGKPMTVKKTARTLSSILEECAHLSVIDYWSLDTEGSELSILKSFPFDKYSFRVLTVEHNRFPVREQIKEFLEDHGYRRIREFEIDDCYVKDVNFQIPVRRSNVWTRFGKGL
jgi:FkbM family methyltransferase